MRWLILLSCLLAFPVKADEPVQAVIVTTVTEGCLNPCVMGIGTFTAYNDVVLKAETSGRIEIIHFQDGDYAKPSQKLFTIYNKEQEARVKKAQATLALSKNVLKRKSELANRGFVTPQALEEADTQVKSDEAELALAKEAFAKTEIYAPFDGALSDRQVSKGAYVLEGDELVRIQDLTPIRLTFQIPQKEIPNVHVGDVVTAVTDVYPDKTFQGKVEAIAPSVNEESRSVIVYSTFSNDEGLLIPGLYGKAKLKTSVNTTPSLTIPEQAVVVRPDGLYVYKKVGEKAVLTKITLGIRTLDQAQVLSGLKKGDVIVLEGQDKIHDGTPIAVTQNAQ
ncbi:MAG: efflux RND transporter periplasmic adaptor subunit [Proteobacteria bacterium]|nr:efflux RND transporter periplasmic adaptor subunit [Pseudomonadota bacterium]